MRKSGKHGPASCLTKTAEAQHEVRKSGNQGSFCLKCGAWQGILGSEPSIQLYIKHLVDIFDQCKRVLKPTGSLWVNLSDSMAGSGSPGGDFRDGKGGDEYLRPYNRNEIKAKSLCGIPARFQIAMIDSGWICRNVIIWQKESVMPESAKDRFTRDWEPLYFFTLNNKAVWWVNEKTKVMVGKQPKGIHGIEGDDWRWIACNNCSLPQEGPNTGDNQGEVWQANNPHLVRLENQKPDKGTGKVLKDCQYRGKAYKIGDTCPRCEGSGLIPKSYWHGMDNFFERQFEPMQQCSLERAKRGWNGSIDRDYPNGPQSHIDRYFKKTDEEVAHIASLGRNKRSVWQINPEPQPASKKQGEVRHYAAYPTKLCTTPILSTCPEQICSKCGLPRVKIYEGGNPEGILGLAGQPQLENGEVFIKENGTRGGTVENTSKEVGLSDCQCGAPFKPGVVADIFGGTGSTGVEARRLGRKAILIDVSESYCELAKRRLEKIPLPMEMK